MLSAAMVEVCRLSVFLLVLELRSSPWLASMAVAVAVCVYGAGKMSSVQGRRHGVDWGGHVHLSFARGRS